MTFTLSEFVITMVSLLGGTGLIGAIILRRLDKMGRKLDDREAAQIEESVVIITGIKAIGHLSEAVAIRQRDGKVNGEMELAMKYYMESKDKLNGYLTRQAAKGTHGRG